MSHKPTLIFVPGAWHSASTWDRVTSIINPQYKCVAVSLPSTTSNSATFHDDVEAVRHSIVAETSQSRNVVVVVHSYGGQVGNSAIKGLTSRDLSGRVLGIVMLASGFTMTGVSFLGGMGGKPPPSWQANRENGYAEIVADPRELFYHDLPEAEGMLWVSQLEKQSLAALADGGEHAYAGWMDVPVWYLATAADKALPIEAQRMFVRMAKDAGGSVTLREIESSHSPMLSKPKESADFILEAVGSFQEQRA